MKGDSGAAVAIVIVIVIAIAAFFLLSGSGGLNFAGFGYQQITYSNDVVTLTNKFVFDRAPYEGQETTIEFAVRNNGRGDAKDINLNIEPPTGFTSEIENRDGAQGKFDHTFDLEEGDSELITIRLTAISGITQVIPVAFRYSVSYPYSGEREFHMPIVGNRNELPKGQTYFVSDSTYGPIQVSVFPPPARETADGGSAIYAISGTQTKFDFAVSNVGGSATGTVTPVVMSGDDLQLTLTNFGLVFCDKMELKGGTDDVLVLKKIYVNEDDGSVGGARLTVPFDVSCVLEVKPGSGVRDGVVKFDYKYDYRILFVDYFNIIPRGTPKIEPRAEETADGSLAEEA